MADEINDNGYLISTSAIQTLINKIKTEDNKKLNINAESFNGNAASATKFQNSQEIKLTGDITGSSSSQAGWEISTTLKNSGVTAGSYGPNDNATPGYGATFNVPYITVDSKGRITTASTKTVKIPASDNTNYWHTTNANGWSNNNLTYTASKSNNNIGDLAFTLQKATGDNYGVVKIGDNIDITEDGVISVAKISSCIALNNKSLYISRTPSETTGTPINIDIGSDNNKITISADGKVITYTITNTDLGENATINDLSENSVIMIAPVYGDNPNENLCYYKVGTDDEYDSELGDSNKGYYKFTNNEFTNEGFTVTSSNFDTLKSNPGLYTRNEGSSDNSSWDFWDSYKIVCTQGQGNNINKLYFYLNNAVPAPTIDNEANLPSSIIKRIQIKINIAIFL